MHTVNGHNIRSCVTTRLIANRIILSLPPSILHPLPHPLYFRRCFLLFPSSPVPLFTFVCPFSKRPQAKQTYGVLTLNKLSDFVIGLLQSAADGNRKNSYPDDATGSARPQRWTSPRSPLLLAIMRSPIYFTAYRINHT